MVFINCKHLYKIETHGCKEGAEKKEEAFCSFLPETKKPEQVSTFAQLGDFSMISVKKFSLMKEWYNSSLLDIFLFSFFLVRFRIVGNYFIDAQKCINHDYQTARGASSLALLA